MGLVAVGMVCLFFGGAAWGYLWNKSQIQKLGEKRRQYEFRFEEAKRNHLFLQRTYAEMTSQAGLEYRIRRLRPDLAQAQVDQTIRLPDAPLATSDEKLVARRPGEEGTN